MKRRCRLKSISAVTCLLTFFFVGTWLVSMVVLTVVTAQEFYDALYQRSLEFANSVSQYSLLSTFYDPASDRYRYQDERPDFLEHQMLLAIGNNVSASYYTSGYYGSGEKSKLIRDINYPLETAVLVYDANGNLLHGSEEDILYFNYYTQEEWDAGTDTAAGLHYGWINMSEGKGLSNQEDPYFLFRSMYADSHSLRDIAAIRASGYFEGSELKPVTLHYVSDAPIFNSAVDRTGEGEWQLLFDRSRIRKYLWPDASS